MASEEGGTGAMTDRQCPSCGGFCGPRGCERENERRPAPCPHIRSSGNTHWCALAEQPTDHREVMQQALEALRNAHAYSVWREEFEDGVLHVIDALRAALGEKR